MPTVHAFWAMSDLDLRKQLGMLSDQWPTEQWLIEVCKALQQTFGTVALCLAGLDLRRSSMLDSWLEENSNTIRLINWPFEH
jgi:hypothetical protein